MKQFKKINEGGRGQNHLGNAYICAGDRWKKSKAEDSERVREQGNPGSRFMGAEQFPSQ